MAWNYSDVRFRQRQAQPGVTGPQSAHEVLMGMKGMAVTFLFLDLTTPDEPVAEMAGIVEEVTASQLTVTLAAPLPGLLPDTRFGVQFLTGNGVLRFHSTAAVPPETGASVVHLRLPRRIESIQRRQFSRAKLSAQVVFAPAPATQPDGRIPPGGNGLTVDLSAGGLQFITNAALSPGHRIYLSFGLPNGIMHRGLEAKVLRVTGDGPRSVVSVKFVNLTESDEAELVQSVFRLQLRGPVMR